jgi:hypothetical protein
VATWRKSSYSSNGSACVEISWRKASYSSNGANCVEVSHNLAAIRDSKNPTGPVLTVDVDRFVRTVKNS